MAELVVLRNSHLPPMTPVLDACLPPPIHLLPGDPPMVFLVEGSRLFETTPEYFDELSNNPENVQRELIESLRVRNANPAQLPLPAPTAISLNVAQSCNISCSYCYADEGRFGGHELMMSRDVASASIDRLLESNHGQRVTVGFIGGEPFLNRPLIHWTVDYATNRAKEVGATVGFSVTTNGTLLNSEDLDLLRAHSFAVSVSLDGGSEVNDRERHSRNGESVFERSVERLRPLLRLPGRARITARATITRLDMRILERITPLFESGFSEVGVSPLRTSPREELALRHDDWPVFLGEMVRAAEDELQQLPHLGTLRFSNLAIALKQLHAGYCKPLPCGSVANYVSVSARGEYFTCHRTVDDPRFFLGNTSRGLLSEPRIEFLRARHVDTQQPCRGCWARYLCGGGCHAEVLSAGRSGCDYIRGWLDYCLRTYNLVLREHPSLFERRN
ncbi:MAG TPA: radical SAM protein [Terracidiphilus sp.]|nr:radical SAM protein [Terracidiphilus sp.]